MFADLIKMLKVYKCMGDETINDIKNKKGNVITRSINFMIFMLIISLIAISSYSYIFYNIVMALYTNVNTKLLINDSMIGSTLIVLFFIIKMFYYRFKTKDMNKFHSCVNHFVYSTYFMILLVVVIFLINSFINGDFN